MTVIPNFTTTFVFGILEMLFMYFTYTAKPTYMTNSIRQPLAKTTIAESAQANSHTIVTV